MNKLALFDLDWTLLEGGNPAHIDAFSEAFKIVYRKKAHINEIIHEGKIDSQIIIEVLEKRGISKEKTTGKLHSALKVMTEYFNKHFKVKPDDVLQGVKELLNQLQKNEVYLGVLTGNIESVALKKLNATTLNNFFQIGAFGNEALKRVDLVEIARRKAEEKFGIPFGKKAIFLVGDTPLDIQCGKDAGVRTIGVASGPNYDISSLQKAGAGLVIPNLANEESREKVIKFILERKY